MMKKRYYPILTGLITLLVIISLQAVTNQWFFKPQLYNSYILQAQAWLDGRLDLGKDYPYLELAIYGGKYFVSFPPFPSYLMLPFTALGIEFCDGIIALICAVIGSVYAYKISSEFIDDDKHSMLLALLVTIGSNWLFTSVNAWVWFIAQNLAFTLTLASLFYALKGKPCAAFTLWACAVGCRPFQIIYIIFILYLLYRFYRNELNQNAVNTIKKRLPSIIPAVCIAVSYMLLNYFRFGSITEFGHNYLPEFTRVETGQFDVSYIAQNFKNLFRLPQLVNGHLQFQSSDGFCMFIASPVLISFFVYWIIVMIKGSSEEKRIFGAVMVIFWVHMVMITAHKTMGGSHYGNRYVTDALPAVYTAMCAAAGKYPKGRILNALPLAAGAALNVMWILMYFK